MITTVSSSDVLNDGLCGLITDTYRRDTRIYREVSNYWRAYKEES